MDRIKPIRPMKQLPALTLLAAIAAFIFLPVRSEITGSLFFAAELALVACADYARRPSLRLTPTASSTCAAKAERLRLAA